MTRSGLFPDMTRFTENYQLLGPAGKEPFPTGFGVPSPYMAGTASHAPARIGRYQILGLLATGGMAEIFLARQEGPTGFERPVVVKRVLPHLARQTVFREMFLDEARIVSRVRHPNVVTVHELGDHENELFLVMEYLEGESVATLLKQSRRDQMPLPLTVVAHLAAEAAAGLHAAHELTSVEGVPLGIVHRDVSPQNLFVLYDGHVKVIDFGIAKAIDRLGGRTQTGQVKGKFAYMAPEQVGAQDVDRRADVFSLGAVLHELITGRKLFGREHDLLVLKAICEERIPLPSEFRGDVPRELDEIVMRALSRKPATRYESAAAMRRDLVSLTRVLEGSSLAEEQMAALMSQRFGQRIAMQQELLRRIRTGQAITHVPAAEPMTGPTPPIKSDRDELSQPPESSHTAAVSPGQVVSVLPTSSRVWPLALAGAVLVASAGLFGGWRILSKRTALREPGASAASQATVPLESGSAPISAGASTDSVPSSSVGLSPGPSATSSSGVLSSGVGPSATMSSAAPDATPTAPPNKGNTRPPPPAQKTPKPAPSERGFTRFE